MLQTQTQVCCNHVLSDQAYEQMLSIWKHLADVLDGLQRWGWADARVGEAFEVAYNAICHALALDAQSVRWEVTLSSLTYEGKPVWRPDRGAWLRIPQQMYGDGVRRIQVLVGIQEQELRELLAVMLRDPALFHRDFAATLWACNFEHIDYELVEEREAERVDEAQCASLTASVRSMAEVDRVWGELSAMDPDLDTACQCARALVIDGQICRTLGIQMVSETLNERFADAFSDGYLDGLERGDTKVLSSVLARWTNEQLALGNHVAVFQMLSELRKSLKARAQVASVGSSPRELDQGIAGAMFPAERLRTVLVSMTSALTEASTDDVQSQIVTTPLVEGIELALDALRSDVLFRTACSVYATVRSERIREVVFAYLVRWLPGRERELEALLVQAPASTSSAIVQLLSQQNTAEAKSALEAALCSPHRDVRVLAFDRLYDAADLDEALQSKSAKANEVRQELEQLLDDADAGVREEAIEMIAKLGIAAAGPMLALRIGSDKFHEFAVTERRKWLDTLSTLNPGRAEKLAIELLDNRQIIPSVPIEQTREVAARFLCTAKSHEALRAVKDATKDRWWNPPGVRDAAARAVAMIAARLATRSSEGILEQSPLSSRPVPSSESSRTMRKP